MQYLPYALCKAGAAAFKRSYFIVEPVVYRSIRATVESWVHDPDTVEVEKTEEDEDEDGNTDDLYGRIHQLSEKIKNELTFHGQSTGCDAQTRVEAEIAAVVDQSSPSKNVDVDERLQKAIEKMAKLDTKLLELVKVSLLQCPDC